MDLVAAKELAGQVRDGNRRALARAITAIESSSAADRLAARILLEELTPYSGNSFRIGISGVPGVGNDPEPRRPQPAARTAL